MKTYIKNVTDTKLFLEISETFTFRQITHKRQNQLKILKTESKTAETLNSFFSNIAKNLNISRHSKFDL